MFVCCASFPLERFEPSFNTNTGTPPAAPGADKPFPAPLLRQQEKQRKNISFSEDSLKNTV
jgi:hypothetical protein